jgi:polyhydroxyalkanoate synthesis repressor PhaR
MPQRKKTRWRARAASAILHCSEDYCAGLIMAKNAKDGDGGPEKVVIQKYANRRLYNKATSTYITLDNLAEMVRDGVDFVVYDAKTNEDITRKVLTQIIFEEENNSEGESLFPVQFLRQLIGFYGNSMQSFLPAYLEMSLDSFTKQQEQFRKQFAGNLPGLTGLKPVEEQVRQNMQMFEQAMKMFTPFGFAAQGAQAAAAQRPSEPAKPAPAADTGLDDLKAQLSAMQAQIEKLASKP